MRLPYLLAMSAVLFPLFLLTAGRAEERSTASNDLHALFQDDWEWRMENFPTWATYLGDRRGNDRWTDMSREAIQRRKEHPREMLQRLREIEPGQLNETDRLSYELFEYDLEQSLEGQQFPTELLAMDQLNGPHLDLAQIAEVTPFRNAEDYENYLSRLRSFPTYLQQITALLEEGIERRWVQPELPLRNVPKQIASQVLADPTDSPIYKPFQEMPDSISPERQAELREAGRATISQEVFPAFLKLRKFMEEEYLPNAAEVVGAAALPDGKAYYAYKARRSTTTDLTPQEIHEIGMAEVKRIRGEMEQVIRDSGFEGDFDAFLEFLRTDPQFYFSDEEDLLIGYRDIAKRADAELPKLFATLPRLPYGVRPVPEHEAPSQPTARYYPGSAEAGRPGYFMANTFALETRPKYEMEALTLHEGVPGHHLQIARAQELEDLPRFRRHGHYTAYVEGWGLYAESLGEEMGFYTTPYSKFGQLTFEMWRAVRLVVDTGMHHMGWSRQQAIDFFKANSGKSEMEIAVEIDRYIVWPGQALAYKIGELKIQQLRSKAEEQLGKEFDIRTFHNALLDHGALPLPVLERQVDRWIAEQKEKAKQ